MGHLHDVVTEVLAHQPVIDGHNDLPWAVLNLAEHDLNGVDLKSGEPRTHTDLPRLRAGGVGGQFWSVFVPAELSGPTAVTATLAQIDFVHRMIERYPDHLQLARTAAGVEAAMASGRLASLLGAEGGHSIGDSLATLRMLYTLGVRYMTLTHNLNVPWADSATDEPGVGGLSDFGREVVAEMNRLGMLVDLSHVAATTMRDALACSESPVMFSHSSARAICDHPRNVPDDVLESLAANDGICMVTFVPSFVSPAVREWDLTATAAAAEAGILRSNFVAYQEFCERWVQDHPAPTARLDDVVRHVEHVREVAGIDHVGLGGDYDGTSHLPTGLEDVSGYPRLLRALTERGWSSEDLGKLTSGNLLRVMRAAESVAAASTREPSMARLQP